MSGILNRPWFAIIIKEFLEIKRDKITIFFLALMPVFNLMIMGYSINLDARNVPTALVDNDKTFVSRTLVEGMVNSGYFAINVVESEVEATELFKSGKASLVVVIPPDFTRDFFAQKKPAFYIKSDETDPVATSNALQVLLKLLETVFDYDTQKVNGFDQFYHSSVTPVIHRMFNPESISQYNIVPGLTGVILMIFPTLMICLSIIRERESGAMLHLTMSLCSPAEIMAGKMVPWLLVGLAQGIVTVTIAEVIMGIPMRGASFELFIVHLVFTLLCLTIGVIFSALISSQVQAMEALSFYFLLSDLLSGFITPFKAMPVWSQMLGAFFPLTYFLRLSKGIMLKGYTLFDMRADFGLLMLLMLLLLWIAMKLMQRNVEVLG